MAKKTLTTSKGGSRARQQTSTNNKVDLTRQSALHGGILGEIVGAVLGTATGALTKSLTGTLMGFTAGIMLGALAGLLIGAIVSQTAGTHGGASIGAYTGMGSGAILGIATGLIIPDSLRLSANTLQTPVLNALISSRFETVVLFSFLICILGMTVGVWVSGKNFIPERILRS